MCYFTLHMTWRIPAHNGGQLIPQVQYDRKQWDFLKLWYTLLRSRYTYHGVPQPISSELKI